MTEIDRSSGFEVIHDWLSTIIPRAANAMLNPARGSVAVVVPGPSTAALVARLRVRSALKGPRFVARGLGPVGRCPKGIGPVGTQVNLVVGTTNNNAPISMSIKRAAQGLIQPGVDVTDGILNTIEMAFRAYDPCLGCATHAMPGETPLIVSIYNHEHELVQEIRRD